MKSKKHISGTTIALSAAAMFALAPMSASAAETGKCFGVNSCKGTSDCATATTACAGHNACAGKGWVKKTQSDCQAKGGEFETNDPNYGGY